MKRSVLVAVTALSFSLVAGTRAHAQWTEGTTYEDGSFSNAPGAGGSVTDNPVGYLQANVAYNASTPMGNQSSGGGKIYQPYVWSGGGTPGTLNVQVNLGDQGSGAGSYQVSAGETITGRNGSSYTVGGAAGSGYSFNHSTTDPGGTQQLTNVAASGSNYGSWTDGTTYTLGATISVLARQAGTNSLSYADSTVIFGQPY